jgi:hypothetical protein
MEEVKKKEYKYFAFSRGMRIVKSPVVWLVTFKAW